MPNKKSYNWEEIKKDIRQAIINGECRNTYSDLSKKFNIPVSTLKRNYTIRPSTTWNLDSDKPKTIEEVAQDLGLDLSKYHIVRFEVKVREIITRDRFKDLSWDQGTIDGVSYLGDLTKTPMWSHHLVLKPKNDILEEKINWTDIVNPVYVKTKFPAKTKKKVEKVRKTLFLTDQQIGWADGGESHDDEFLRESVILAREEKPDYVIYGGDLIDFSELSDKFIKQPGSVMRTQDAVVRTAQHLSNMRLAVPNAEIIYIEGNHEDRLKRALSKHIIALSNLKTPSGHDFISIPNMLDLASMKIEYYGNYPNGYFKLDSVVFTHGDVVSTTPGATANKMLDRYGTSVVFGHIHRAEFVTDRFYSDMLDKKRPVWAYSPGCGCKVGPEVPGATANANWRQGAGLILTGEGGQSRIIDLPFSNGSFIFN